MKQLPALILAAGRGERMRPLTDRTPKPLLPVHGKPLIEWHLEALAQAGVKDVVVNTAWLEEQFPTTLGDGSRWGLRIRYSMEGRDHGGALETAGGIAKAAPWLIEGGAEAFWVVSGDIHAPDFRFDAAEATRFLQSGMEAHLWLVPNPPFHPGGDFGFDAATGLALPEAGADGRRWTYSNLALLRPSLTNHIALGTAAKLGPLLYQGMSKARISATIYDGRWDNVGTPEQLAKLNA